MREKPRTTVVRGRRYDVAAHQQAAMPELRLAGQAAESEHDDQEPEAGPRPVVDLMALRAALEASRTDVEALDFTAEQLRHVQDAFTKVGDGARTRTKKHADRQDAPAQHPAREGDQRVHRSQQPDPRHGPGPAAERRVRWRTPPDALRLRKSVSAVPPDD
ncbi:hypothetical protein V1J52_22145 [Streptomyces sp. TRM 70351]|uniref:hypothetical protein n=1 Tax=Streptomyces sp. TRM 70351 TaxID=3116552 RepID=UPI002E7B0519|nr:hypothetical protein [Streptomyces sp. TRM 70351]MEE1930849.1 hypothetical protein [Streptomyces sp. TRM 70351]